jgi:hypothetical protein
MQPKAHIILGIFFVALLYFIFPQISLIGLLIIFLSSVLIDVDHYIYYIIKKRDFNLIKGYNWYKKEIKETLALPMNERKKRYTGFFLFHGIEVLVVLFLNGIFISPIFTFVFIGFSFHWIIDTPHEYYIKRTWHKSSWIYNYIQWKKLTK